MITTYLLQNCDYCKDLLQYIKKNPNLNICLIMISKNDIPSIKKNEPRIKQFPVAFTGNPKVNGLPYKNAHMISGSQTILDTLKNNFGKVPSVPRSNLVGNKIEIDYAESYPKNVSNLNNIRKHRNNCFGNVCNVMDRPYGPNDNQYILQGFQPECARPLRSDLPIKMNKFGMTTPGTKAWQLERKPWPQPQILIDDRNMKQKSFANVMAKINQPMTYSNDYQNQKIWDPLKMHNNFGKQKRKESLKPKLYKNRFVSAPVNSNYPYLTYAAGGNGISCVTGKNFFPEQVPIERSPKSAFISGNLKNYVKNNAKHQQFLYNGFDSDWSINGQGIHKSSENKYGKVPKVTKVPKLFKVSKPPKDSKKVSKSKYGNAALVQTAFNSSQGDSGVAQYFKKGMFPQNGNAFGKLKDYKNKITKNTNKITKNSSNNVRKDTKNSSKNSKKFVSPLGIEISFN